MVDLTPLEQKRADASAYRGVSYDARMGKFVAMITINGEKKYLGSFLTAEDASFAYDVERAAHRVVRKRIGSAKSLRQAMVEFVENAEYSTDRYKNIVAGQIFTAPDGQRFRIEGFKALRGKGWYVWSAPCRFCGALFEQETSLRLRTVSGMARNCAQHHKQIHKDVAAPDVWPDPVEWCLPPVQKTHTAVFKKSRRGDAATERAYNAHLDSVWQQIKDDPALVVEFNYLENQGMAKFTEDFYAKYPDGDSYERIAAWMDQPNEPFAELLKKKQRVRVVEPVNARFEDTIALAEDMAADNSDLA